MSASWADVAARCAPPRGWAVDCYLCRPRPLKTATVLDEALGGLMPGLTLLGGQASAGKSALACHAASKVADAGGRVLYLTLDDTWGNVRARCMSAWSVSHNAEVGGAWCWSDLDRKRDNLARWRTSDPTRDAFELRKIDEPLMTAALWDGGVGDRLAIVDDCPDVAQVEEIVTGLIDAGEPPTLVVIDYLQQFATGNVDTDQNEITRVSEVASRLQRLALWGGIPFLTISSLRKMGAKELEDSEPTLDWFRGSAVVGYAAWAACVLTRGENEGDGWREVELKVVKNKAGRTGQTVDVELWGACSYTKPYQRDELEVGG